MLLSVGSAVLMQPAESLWCLFEVGGMTIVWVTKLNDHRVQVP